jgi:hypothetical protein
MSATGSNNRKTPAPVPPQTQTRREDDWEDQQEAKVNALERHIKILTDQLNNFGQGHNRDISELRESIQQTDAQFQAPSPMAPKLPKADNFDGTRSKLRGFLTQMNMYLDVNKHRLNTEASKVIFVSTYLRGQAWDWLEPYVREYYEKDSSEWSTTATTIFSSYLKFREHLEKTFGDIDAKKTAERKLKRLRQTTSASVYTAEFMQQAAILGWDDYALIPYYDEGLKSHIKDELARRDRPETMDELIDFAVRVDNRFYNRQIQKREVEG